MQPAQYALSLYRGDSYQWQFRFWQDSAKTQPADLTGVSVQATIEAADGSQMACTCSVTLPNSVLMSITPAAWGTAGNGRGRWDLQFTMPDGSVKTQIAGL